MNKKKVGRPDKEMRTNRLLVGINNENSYRLDMLYMEVNKPFKKNSFSKTDIINDAIKLICDSKGVPYPEQETHRQGVEL